MGFQESNFLQVVSSIYLKQVAKGNILENQLTREKKEKISCQVPVLVTEAVLENIKFSVERCFPLAELLDFATPF